MKILFTGLGSIGSRHRRLIERHFGYNCFSFSELGRDWRRVEDLGPDVVFITCPTEYHISNSTEAAKRGYKLFIEKPLGLTTNGLPRLLYYCQDLPTYVAYNLRHHPDLRDLKAAMTGRNIKFFYLECRTDYSKWKKNWDGGGVLFELSHEIDLARYLGGEIYEINGYADSMYAWLEITHTNGDETLVVLHLGSKQEKRGLKLDTEYSRLEIQYRTSDEVYLRQLEYFFGSLWNPRMENNVFDAAKLFKKICEFKNGPNYYDTLPKGV